jgi:hypothetical protein
VIFRAAASYITDPNTTLSISSLDAAGARYYAIFVIRAGVFAKSLGTEELFALSPQRFGWCFHTSFVGQMMEQSCHEKQQ